MARLGGDEFAALIETEGDPQATLRLADRVLEALSRPTQLMGTEVMPGVSVGITFSDLGYRTAEEIMRDADLAMYEAKSAGRGRVVRFECRATQRAMAVECVERIVRTARVVAADIAQPMD